VISGVRSRLLGGCVERRTLEAILDNDAAGAALQSDFFGGP